MKTLEVAEKYFKAKRMSSSTQISINQTFKQLNQLFIEFPAHAGEITEFMKYLEDNLHLKDTTLRLKLAHLNMIYNFLEKQYDFPNPMKKVDSIKVKHQNRRYFTPAELVKIMQACETNYEKALISTLIDSACRIGELVNLKTSDIEINKIHVKGKTGDRTYRLDPNISKMLFTLSLETDNDGFVFKRKNWLSQKYPNMNIIMCARNIIKRAGITGIKLGAHTIRHSSASLVAKASGSLLTTQMLLQHDNSRTTAIYMHDVDQELQQDFSPFKLVGEQVFGKDDSHIKQSSMLTSGSDIQPSIDLNISDPDTKTNEVDNLLASSFSDVPSDIIIHPYLKSKDMALIKRALIALCQFGQITTDSQEAREFYRRITRKVKTIEPSTHIEPENKQYLITTSLVNK